MKALIIAPQPFFSPRGTPFSVYFRTLISGELGVQSDFLTYGEGEDVDIPGVRFFRIPRFKFLGNVKIGPSALKLFLDVFIFFRMIGLLLRNRYDFVHAHEEAVFFAFFLKPIFKYKLVYDMHSSLPQQLTNFEFSTSKLLINLFKNLEDACLRSADAIITICPDLYDYVNNLIDNKEKHYLIENSIFDPVKTIRTNGKEAQLNSASISIDTTEISNRLKSKKTIVYAGTLESYQGIDMLIPAFEKVSQKHQDALLLIVGGTKEQVEYYARLAEELSINDNVIFTGRLSQKSAKYFTNRADVLVSPRSAGTNTPLKIYEQIASGKPLVATNIYSHTQVLNEKVAFLVNPTPQDLAYGISAALESNGEAKEKIRHAKELYKNMYSRKVYKSKLESLFKYLQNL